MAAIKDISHTIYQSISLSLCHKVSLEECIKAIYATLGPFIPASLIICYFINRTRKKITVLTTAGITNEIEEIQDEDIVLLSKDDYETNLYDKKNHIHLWSDYRNVPSVALHYQHILPAYCSRMNISFPDKSGESIISLSFCAKPSGMFNDSHAALLVELRPFLSALMANFLPANPEEDPASIFAYGTNQDDIALLRQCNGMSAVLRDMEAVAGTNATVLIQGESGVGKEVVARAIHRLSLFADGPFVPVNCGALPDSLIDSALFGHEKGAFTGAQSSSRGFFEQAQGGTLFLDEIGELPLAAQARLLRVLERRELQRVGGERRIGLNIRILAATHRNLPNMTQAGTFREDLWYRLSLFPLKIPPLRQRREDIIVLIRHFCAAAPARLGLSGTFTAPPSTVNAMLTARWPGNVRQLQHAVERAIIRAKMNGENEIAFIPESDEDDVPSSIQEEGETKLEKLDALTKSHIINALRQSKGRVSGEHGAALLLGVNPNTLRSRMKRMGISAKDLLNKY